MNLRDATIIAVDSETTGVDPAIDQVWEIGTARGETGQPVKTWSRLYRPANPHLSDEVRRVCHVDDELQGAILSAAPFAVSDAEMLVRAAQGSIESRWVLTSYNGLAFDWPILTAECARVGVTLPQPADGVRLLDACLWVRHFHRDRRDRSLAGAYIGLCDGKEIAAHRTRGDTIMTLKVTNELARRHRLPMDVDELLAWQGDVAAAQAAQWERFHYYAYEREGAVYCGFGKHCGRPLSEVGDYARWAVDRLGGEMPPEALAAFKAVASR